ncbi:hypothetical protein FRB99_003779 [Tulasnella sp. 403]|nr:hypothetical protein FRB99_003779 [Tulasnella sp. 403]
MLSGLSRGIRTSTKYPLRRSLFSLPDFPNLSPFGTNGSGNDVPHSYHERKIMPYSQRELYRLVSDVDSYHRFLPFCKRSRVLSSLPSGSDTNVSPYTVDAELTVGFLAFEESYVSKVTCTPFEKVEAIGSSNLFKTLTTTWRFQPASATSPHPTKEGIATKKTDGLSSDTDSGPTLLSINLSYAFANPIHASLASKVFEGVSKQMVEAFERRCIEVYGQGIK